MSESLEPEFQSPEEVEVLRIELAKPFHKKLPRWVRKQYDDSYGGEDEDTTKNTQEARRRGWKLVAGGTAIAITLGGMEYFRRKYGKDDADE